MNSLIAIIFMVALASVTMKTGSANYDGHGSHQAPAGASATQNAYGSSASASVGQHYGGHQDFYGGHGQGHGYDHGHGHGLGVGLGFGAGAGVGHDHGHGHGGHGHGVGLGFGAGLGVGYEHGHGGHGGHDSYGGHGGHGGHGGGHVGASFDGSLGGHHGGAHVDGHLNLDKYGRPKYGDHYSSHGHHPISHYSMPSAAYYPGQAPCKMPECNIVVKSNNYLQNAPTEIKRRPLKHFSRHSLLSPFKGVYRSRSGEHRTNKQKSVVIQD